MLVTCTTVLINTLVLNSFPDSEFEQFSSYVSVHYNCFKYHFFLFFFSTTFLCLFYPELIDFTTTVIYASMGSFPLKIFASSVILK